MRPILFLATGIFLALSLPANLHARENQRLDTGWHFKLADAPGAEQSSFDDSDWETVSLPHNWGWQDGAGWQELLSRAGLVSP